MKKIASIQEEIIDEFNLFDDWMQRYEYMIELGKSLPIIDSKNKIDDNVYEVELVQATLGVAPGQFGVIYQNTKLVGGGRISTKILEDVNE